MSIDSRRRFLHDVIPWLPSPNPPCLFPFAYTDAYKRKPTWTSNRVRTESIPRHENSLLSKV